MKSILAMFPGQGSQYVGMGKELLKQFPYVREVFEEAEDTTKKPIRDLCFEGPESDLMLTENTQPTILTVSYATWKVLNAELELQIECFAGHSLGEYSALVASEKMEFAEAAQLVTHRGQAMQEAVPRGVGAMAAVMRLAASDLELACREASDDHGQVSVVNYNSPQQLVVAGHKVAVDRLVEMLKQRKVRCVSLPVSAPFHSSLMKPAREKMAPLLESSRFHRNSHKVLINLTAEAVEEYVPQYLIEQIDHPVRWTQSIELAQKMGTTVFCEVGPGEVLTGLVRRFGFDQEMTFISTDSVLGGIEKLKALSS